MIDLIKFAFYLTGPEERRRATRPISAGWILARAPTGSGQLDPVFFSLSNARKTAARKSCDLCQFMRNARSCATWPALSARASSFKAGAGAWAPPPTNIWPTTCGRPRVGGTEGRMDRENNRQSITEPANGRCHAFCRARCGECALYLAHKEGALATSGGKQPCGGSIFGFGAEVGSLSWRAPDDDKLKVICLVIFVLPS